MKLVFNALALAFLIFSTIVLGMALEYARENHVFEKDVIAITSGNCSSGEIKADANCLREELSKFYRYNASNTGTKYDLDILKREGGVCSHYSRWYSIEGNKAGYYTREVVMDMNKDFAHMVTIMSNAKGYCILDQTEVKCFSVELPDDEIL